MKEGSDPSFVTSDIVNARVIYKCYLKYSIFSGGGK